MYVPVSEKRANVHESPGFSVFPIMPSRAQLLSIMHMLTVNRYRAVCLGRSFASYGHRFLDFEFTEFVCMTDYGPIRIKGIECGNTLPIRCTHFG